VPDGGADGIDIQCVAGAKVTGIDHGARETIDAQGHHRTVSIGARFTEPLWGIDQELSQFARPDAAGRYAIDGLLPGAYELTLVGDGSDPAPGTSVVLSDGQVLHWDPTPATPTTTRRIAVRVLDPTGEPVTAWGVVARRDDWRRNQVTDAEGRCVFDCDIDSPVDLSVMPPDTAFAVQTVRAAPGLTAFTVHLRADQMPTAQLTARLVGPGIDMTEVVAVAHQEADYRRSYRLRIDPRSGRAASGPMIPGQYSLAISRGRAPLGFAPPRPVAAETVVDFGEVAIGEPASILVVVADLNASPRRDIRVQLRGAGRESFSKVPARSMPEGILVADLPAGLSFEVLVTSSEMVPEWSRVHLAAGERHRISVTGRRGTTCVFEYATATATATATSTATATATATAAAATTAIGSSILIRDAAGTPLLSRRLTATDGRLEQALAPGRYELQIKCGAEVKSRFIQVPTSATPVAIAVDAPR
jgi:hypothetical protein